jgi:hypothetical protein
VAESEDVLDYAICFDHDKLALGYIHHVQTVLYVHALVSGERLLSIPMPAPGTVQGTPRSPSLFPANFFPPKATLLSRQGDDDDDDGTYG